MDGRSQSGRLPESRSARARPLAAGCWISDEQIVQLQRHMPAGTRVDVDLRWKLENAVAEHRMWKHDRALSLKPSASLRQISAIFSTMATMERQLKNIICNDRTNLTENEYINCIHANRKLGSDLEERYMCLERQSGKSDRKGNHRREFIVELQHVFSEHGVELVYQCHKTGKRRCRTYLLKCLFNFAGDDFGEDGIDDLVDELWPPADKSRS